MNTPIAEIKAFRKAKGVTQKEMAKKLGCNLKTYQRFENGKNKRREFLTGVCKELGLTLIVVENKNIIK